MIVLPFPDSRLFPNAKRRKNWRTYAPVAKAERELGAGELLAQVGPMIRHAIKQGEAPIPMVIKFYPPDRRHRDDDGIIGAFKHLRDGLADGLGVDDRRFRPHYYFEEPEKPGRVEVTFG